jgi:hypothetical protein
MKILFYLPLARNWMLDHVLEPMIAKLASVAEVHILIASVWIDRRSTSDIFQSIASHPNIIWHPLTLACDELDAFDMDGPTPAVIELVGSIAPDYCLCRSANPSLPDHFPAPTKYIMEAGAPPFRIPRNYVSLQPQIFDHGLIPDLPLGMQDALMTMISPFWTALEAERAPDPLWLQRHALPTDKKIIAVPLEYDHPDNLFGIHRSIRSNIDFVAGLLDRVNTSLFLAVTDHPLNKDLVDRCELRAMLEAQHGKARLLSPADGSHDITSTLVQHADGMIVSDSKSFAATAFYGKPLLRISKFASGRWLNAYADLGKFVADLGADCAEAPARSDAMLWFAHYLAAQVFAPGDAAVTGDELLERVVGIKNPDRWAKGIARMKLLAQN